MLTALLAAAALLAGLAGAWSPCGLSMVDTLAPSAAGGRRRVALAGAWAFALGALAGGLATFGGLALLGAALGAGGGVAAALAAAALLVAAAGDAAGRRIVPQVRRQVPESWRRVLPLPVAAGLYGVLLGLGFTTFVLSFATYGLAAVCLALGEPAAGLAIGLAFGAGRALPVVALAPLQDRDAAAAVAAGMAERPDVLRALRAGAAGGLAAAAAAIALGGAPAQAAELFTSDGADPSAAGGQVAWQVAGGGGAILRDGRTDLIPGADPALGPTYVAWHDDAGIDVVRRDDFAPVARVPATGVEALAVSDRWLAWSARNRDGRPQILAIELAAPLAPPRVAASASGLGRPAIDGDRLVFHVSGAESSRIVEVDLASRVRRTRRRSRSALLLNPSLSGDRLVYVRSGADRQRVLLARPGRRDRVLFSTTPTARRDAGHEAGKRLHRQGYRGGRRPPQPRRPRRGLTVTLWTTALDGDTAYVTRLRHRSGRTTASLLRMHAPR